ncbi:MAG: methyltransferase domain-containing protein [Treponema sp.]|nr:methyltransferase domain-containing protein [Treponema sp.]
MTHISEKLAVIIQCRLSSSRLPEKALKLLGGHPVLEWTLNAMKTVRAKWYYVATDEESYDTLKPVAERCGWNIFKGPLEDVLERYCLLIEKLNCKTVLRATADNPFLFYEAAQLLCEEFSRQSERSKCDYMTWTGLPHGSGVEIFSAESLLKARHLTSDAFDHEHVGPALYNHKDMFTSLFYRAPARFFYPDYRTTIDTASDFRRSLAIVAKLSGGEMPNAPYTTEEIVSAIKDSSVHDAILFIPSVKKGRGTGHLRRCLKAACDTGGFVYIPKDYDLEETDSILKEYQEQTNGLKDYQIIRTFPEKNEFSLIVTDLFSMEEEEAKKIRTVSRLASIDEGSDFTDYSDFLLDIIPSYHLKRPSNLSVPDFMEKPKNRKNVWNFPIKKVLVTIGGEDPANLTTLVAEYFSKGGCEVTAILSKDAFARSTNSTLSEKINFIETVPNLKESLFEFDLVATHYGLTAFEALSAGCAVILLPTSKLHENLAKKHGFFCLSRKDLSASFDTRRFSNSVNLMPKCISNDMEKPLGAYIKQLSHGRRLACPLCGVEQTKVDEIVERTESRTFRRCQTCSLIYISWTIDGAEKAYQKEYFTEDYKKQYGKTYLEDFDSIKKTSLHRMMYISLYSKKNKYTKPTVLDIGCAYGPFLSAAKESGWQVFGTDISSDAIEYVQNTLLFSAVQSDFPDFDPSISFGINQFDAVTMWYVIEHFFDLSTVLKKVNKILKKDGIFAFSTPSAQGISARANRHAFFENSPADHYSIWEPSKCSKILQRFGFHVLKIVSTGHHAERFPLVKKHDWKKGSALYNFYTVKSRFLQWGDTFEIYLRKVKEL